MILYNPDQNSYGNTLEIHYWFNDDSHSMDATVQNRCENEVLGILKEIANVLSVEISIETEPIGNGGLRKWLKLTQKGENKNGTITTTIIIALATVILTTPIQVVTQKVFDKIFEDKEISQLQKEKLRLEIDKLKSESKKNIETIDANTVIKKKKSNFYENLEKYPKVQQVSYVVSDESKIKKTKEKIIKRHHFNNFILISDDLDPIENDNAIIEIISPVLKKGKYRWTGYYEGVPINFTMKSAEFKALVQSGKIEFKNGSSINCSLNIKRKMDNEGNEKTTGYEVSRVNEYFDNDKPIETQEGKKYKREKDAEEKQTSLFSKDNDTSKT